MNIIKEIKLSYSKNGIENIKITEQTTNSSYNHILDINLLQTSIDVTSYPTGIYLVSLICDGNLITTKQLLKI